MDQALGTGTRQLPGFQEPESRLPSGSFDRFLEDDPFAVRSDPPPSDQQKEEPDIVVQINPKTLGHVYTWSGSLVDSRHVLDTLKMAQRAKVYPPPAAADAGYTSSAASTPVAAVKKPSWRRCKVTICTAMVAVLVALLWIAAVMRAVNPYTCRSKWELGSMAAFTDRKSKVLIVGNGPCVMKAKSGKLVDEFDEVVRFNGYKILPEHTGRKTTIVFYNAGTKRPKRDISQVCSNCLEAGGWNGFWAFGLFARLFCGDGVDKNAICMPSKFINQLRNKLDYSKAQRMWHGPTSGMMAIDYFTERYDEVTIYGFDFTNGLSKNGPKDHHYYGNRNWKDAISDLFHLPSKEYVHVKSLIREGRVKVLAGGCPTASSSDLSQAGH